jgi:cyclopropane-fatty-acyl-phospholipid synthase
VTATRAQQLTGDDRSRRFIEWLLGDYHPRDFAVRFMDESVWPAETPTPALTVVLKHSGALRRMFWPPKGLTLAESYLFDDYDLEGDAVVWWLVAEHLHRRRWALTEKLRFLRDVHRFPRAGVSPSASPSTAVGRLTGRQHSTSRDQQAVRHHYDFSNEFFQLWLDSRMVYSCAYFPTQDSDLEFAQERKLDYACRKLRLSPGERLLDIGCGWGAMAIHAAERYGVRVLGITLSKAQAEVASRRVREAGLEGRVEIRLLDYREVPGQAEFDKIISIGMLEHVGDAQFPAYLAHAWRLLKPAGVFLNHGIALNTDRKMPKPPTFASKYIFPDGELLRLSRNLELSEEAGFEVRDVESLREHYHLTCLHWLRRLEARADEARALVGEVGYRTYRLYLAISALGFRVGWFNLYQTLLVKAPDGRSGFPLTRGDWYC